MAKYSHACGGVGAPVGLTVFKTAGGSLGAVPGGFDSHTPLPRTFAIDCNFQRNCEMKWNSHITPKKFNERAKIIAGLLDAHGRREVERVLFEMGRDSALRMQRKGV